MPVIKMSRTERGSCNGLTVETFEQGVEYDIPDSLIVEFATMGAIEGEELRFRFYPDKNSTEHIQFQGKLGVVPEPDMPQNLHGPVETPEQPIPVIAQPAVESRDQMSVPPRRGRPRKTKE